MGDPGELIKTRQKTVWCSETFPDHLTSGHFFVDRVLILSVSGALGCVHTGNNLLVIHRFEVSSWSLGVLPLPVTYLLQPSNGFTSRIYANQWYSSLSLVAFSIACLNVYVAANHFQCLCGLSVKYCVAWIFNLLLLECLNPVQMDDLGWHCSFTEMLLGPRLVLP